MADQIISTWGNSPLRPTTISSRDDFEREFGPDPLEEVAYAVAHRSQQLAIQRNAFARRLLEDRLPSFLHWTLDRPRALRWVLRAVPRWRPTMTVVDLRATQCGPLFADSDGRLPREISYACMTADAARATAQQWIAEMRAHGNRVPDGGLIFTYTDASGLPAEVYL